MVCLDRPTIYLPVVCFQLFCVSQGLFVSSFITVMSGEQDVFPLSSHFLTSLKIGVFAGCCRRTCALNLSAGSKRSKMERLSLFLSYLSVFQSSLALRGHPVFIDTGGLIVWDTYRGKARSDTVSERPRPLRNGGSCPELTQSVQT